MTEVVYYSVCKYCQYWWKHKLLKFENYQTVVKIIGKSKQLFFQTYLQKIFFKFCKIYLSFLKK